MSWVSSRKIRDCQADNTLVATLYFVFVVDQSESELGILDLIQVRQTRRAWKRWRLTQAPEQVFVESLDRCFENVCELDLIFHFDDVRLPQTDAIEAFSANQPVSNRSIRC